MIIWMTGFRRLHAFVNVLARAARQALHAKVDTEDVQHQVYSPGARPDVRIKTRTRSFKLLEVKVLCPISSNPELTGYEGTFADDVPHGQGCMVLPTGDKYRGQVQR